MAVNLVRAKYRVVLVELITEDNAVALLKSRALVDELCEADTRVLVVALEYIPLTVTHVGAYIKAREPRITVLTYLELFRESKDN